MPGVPTKTRLEFQFLTGLATFDLSSRYKKHKNKTPQDPSLTGKFKAAADLQLAVVAMFCFCMRVANRVIEDWTSPLSEASTASVLFLSVGIFACEPTMSVRRLLRCRAAFLLLLFWGSCDRVSPGCT